jgi:hypothetical protein
LQQLARPSEKALFAPFFLPMASGHDLQKLKAHAPISFSQRAFFNGHLFGK